MNIIQEINQEQVNELNKNNPEFQAGDTLKVHLWIVEKGGTKRVQIFEGVCIARKNKGVNSSFTVRKISKGYGVEKQLPLHSPTIDKIEVVRKGVVRRAKLYYLRDRSGKSARIKEKLVFDKKKAS